MKKAALAVLSIALATGTHAQVITDTVSTGATYANQVWYSLENDDQGTAAKNNWDLAFDASGFGSTILINSITGTTLWKYPNADTSGWATVDTTGISTWSARWNSDTSWSEGAMGRYADPSNPSDLDWGLYNMTTHIVTGDSLYIIKLANGDFKKLWVQSLTGSVYTFKYANIDGSGLQNATLNKTTYSGKNFGYYSLQSNAAVDREPASANWDLLFSQYTALIPGPYTVTGLLANKGVEIAKFTALADKTTFTAYGTGTFVTPINTIGYDWKTFTGTGYSIKDSTVYFVKTVSGDIWKMIYTGFGGSATGNHIFTKEKLYTETGIAIGNGQKTISIALYPNPANGQDVYVLYSADGAVSVTVSDISGRTVFASNIAAQQGLQQLRIPTQSLLSGIYIVSVATGEARAQQRLVIR
ncbi:MAG: T9SS type A sorting domain-containing protein [Chitinophagaceae bacterium]|nr:T9SS type A sorting domain-containing protein [Chitinophagaceae bacterium]